MHPGTADNMQAMRAAMLVLGAWGFCAACTTPSALLRVPPSPPRQPVLRVELRQLPVQRNGLRVVVMPDPKAREVRVTLRVLVGDVDDPQGRNGLAHLVEHLTFGAPATTTQRPLSSELDAVASTYGATTELENTSYTSTADPSRLPELLRLEGLRLSGNCEAWTDEVFARERDIVRNEARERGRAHRLYAAVISSLYPELHPYRSRSGNDEDSLARITRADACGFFRAHYAPNNAVLMVSGNVTVDAVAAAIPATLGRVPTRTVATRAPIPPPLLRRPDAITVPRMRPAAVLAWPLPADPSERARLRAAVVMLATYGRSRVEGELSTLELGGPSARTIGLVIEPRKDQPLDAALREVEAARLLLIQEMTADELEHVRMHSIYLQLQRLEDAARRDDLVLEHVIASRDPAQALRGELDAVLQLTSDQARALLRDRLLLSTAAVARLQPGAGAREGDLEDPEAPDGRRDEVASAPPVHVPDEPRIDADPAAARTAASRAPAPEPFAGARERKLRNGMTVILLPLSSVPTVDARVVFRAGLGDEPPGQRGVARLAAFVLQPRPYDEGWIRDFILAGASYDVQVGRDHTSFIARGLEGHIDLLLSRLGLQLKYGMYPFRYDNRLIQRWAESLGGAWRTGRGRWYEALYGEDHPYTRGLVWRPGVVEQVDRMAMFQYREEHLQPSNATLIVAGGFDVAQAERWIDHVFGDWSGPPPRPARPTRRAAPRAIALARAVPGSLVKVELAFPIGGDRVAGLVAAQMVSSVVGDVRAQLGASYGLSAELDDARLSRSIVVAGSVAADQAAAAMALIRERIRGLAAADAGAARRFVVARRTVMTRLGALGAGSRELAERAEAAVRQGSLASYAADVEAARILTLSGLSHTLQAVDLERAAILMTGPRAAVTAAFSAVDRTPEFFEAIEAP
jgi:zinc protease